MRRTCHVLTLAVVASLQAPEQRAELQVLSPAETPAVREPLCEGCNADAWDMEPLDAPPRKKHWRTNLVAFAEPCFNGCSGLGVCKEGLCECSQGASSTSTLPANPISTGAYDCAPTKAPLPELKTKGFIYIYDMPASLGLLRTRQYGRTADDIYGSEYKFFETLMGDWSVRTLDPHKASLYYVPTWIYYDDNNVCFADEHFESLKPHLTHWGKKVPDGRDHVFFFSGDKGACGAPPGPIYMAHWGLTVPWAYMGKEVLYQKDLAAQKGADRGTSLTADTLAHAPGGQFPCADQRSIIVPPLSAYEPTAESRAVPLQRDVNYKYLLSFAGGISGCGNAEAPLAAPSGMSSGITYELDGNPAAYSQGVRQLVYALHGKRADFYVHPGQAPNDIFESSKFCLAPSGDGFGMRLSKSVLMGCVPLIIQPKVRQPFDDILPYAQFALLIDGDNVVEEIKNLPRTLAAITDEQHFAMRQKLRQYADSFHFLGNGTAYTLATQALKNRADALSKSSPL